MSKYIAYHLVFLLLFIHSPSLNVCVFPSLFVHMISIEIQMKKKLVWNQKDSEIACYERFLFPVFIWRHHLISKGKKMKRKASNKRQNLSFMFLFLSDIVNIINFQSDCSHGIHNTLAQNVCANVVRLIIWLFFQLESVLLVWIINWSHCLVNYYRKLLTFCVVHTVNCTRFDTSKWSQCVLFVCHNYLCLSNVIESNIYCYHR